MESTVLEDDGADLHRRKVQFQYFSVHNVFHRSPRRQKKVMSSAKFLRKKCPIYSLLEGGRWVQKFGPFSPPPLCFALSNTDHWMDM